MGKVLVGKLLVGKLLVGKLLVGKLLVGKLLVKLEKNLSDHFELTLRKEDIVIHHVTPVVLRDTAFKMSTISSSTL